MSGSLLRDTATYPSPAQPTPPTPFTASNGHARSTADDANPECAFCSDPKTIVVFETAQPIPLIANACHGIVMRDCECGLHWSACFECAEPITAGDLSGLIDRLEGSSMPLIRTAFLKPMRTALAQILATLRPRHILADKGSWQPRVLPAASLPKIRDRLAALIADDTLSLPFGLEDPDTRTPLATSLATSRPYWIDDEFSTLTRNAAATMPRLAFTPADLPAAHGFVAWAQPIDRLQYVAASWSSHGDAVHLVGYRSVGADLPAAALQRLRSEFGWLIPVYSLTLRPGQQVGADSPAAALVTTWRLIRQRLADITPAKVDKAIRKKYQRSGRSAPEVQLVRIRGSRPRRTSPPGPSARTTADHEFRWWVSPHWRHQPYGPGRKLRDWIVVRPHLHGPEDKPIKATTTVRVLGSLPPRPDRPPASGR
jgi:hypothetical protein